ncbi:hypothetical protein E3T43_16420 [Cryobacterium sp. Hh7]|uniref:hypothetical protein n=1 Tax=Cryobacterium sp. Hh7 TaxID=1259159 RepID=UPI00106A63CD|nr:hypothetical protein [Cryobacterium sp. Hh7]TFD51858.1 hypothetical protein E3T43_16420 [Cryobacterium sp. Hh7]
MSVATDWFLGKTTATADAPGTTTAPPATRGRTRIVPKALRRIVGLATAESLGVEPGQVGVKLGDDHGMLALTISTSICVVPLSRVIREPAVIARTGGTILARAATAQIQIRRRVGELTGTNIGRVTVRLTGIDVQPERRVR